MSSKQVTQFNHAVNNSPSQLDHVLLEQIVNQCTFLVEEVLEMKEAALEGDWIGVLDAHADIRFVRDYLDDLCVAAGLNINKAFRKVCANNAEKYSTSRELVLQWQAEKAISHPEIETYIAETEYEGETYYTLRRKDNGKVVKHNNFTAVDLTDCLPADLIKKEN